MQYADLTVEADEAHGGGDVANVYGDGGGGEIDYDTPLNSTPLPLFPGSTQPLRFFAGPWLEAPWLGWPVPDPPNELLFHAGPYYHGEFNFGVKIQDAAGNKGEPTGLAMTINSNPTPPIAIQPPTYDDELDRLSFAFTGSPEVEA